MPLLSWTQQYFRGGHFSCGTSPAPAFTHPADIALVGFDFAGQKKAFLLAGN